MGIPLEYLLQKLVEGHHGYFLFSGVSSVSTRDADRPGVIIAEEGDGVGDRGSGDTTSQLHTFRVFGACPWDLDVETSILGLFSTAKISGFSDYQLLD